MSNIKKIISAFVVFITFIVAITTFEPVRKQVSETIHDLSMLKNHQGAAHFRAAEELSNVIFLNPRHKDAMEKYDAMEAHYVSAHSAGIYGAAFRLALIKGIGIEGLHEPSKIECMRWMEMEMNNLFSLRADRSLCE